MSSFQFFIKNSEQRARFLISADEQPLKERTRDEDVMRGLGGALHTFLLFLSFPPLCSTTGLAACRIGYRGASAAQLPRPDVLTRSIDHLAFGCSFAPVATSGRTSCRATLECKRKREGHFHGRLWVSKMEGSVLRKGTLDRRIGAVVACRAAVFESMEEEGRGEDSGSVGGEIVDGVRYRSVPRIVANLSMMHGVYLVCYVCCMCLLRSGQPL